MIRRCFHSKRPQSFSLSIDKRENDWTVCIRQSIMDLSRCDAMLDVVTERPPACSHGSSVVHRRCVGTARRPPRSGDRRGPNDRLELPTGSGVHNTISKLPTAILSLSHSRTPGMKRWQWSVTQSVCSVLHGLNGHGNHTTIRQYPCACPRNDCRIDLATTQSNSQLDAIQCRP